MVLVVGIVFSDTRTKCTRIRSSWLSEGAYDLAFLVQGMQTVTDLPLVEVGNKADEMHEKDDIAST
eukprot:2238930-Amphidinium_carterae.1